MDWRLCRYDEVPSTQDIIKEKSAESEGLVVQAKSQTKGRGRQNREWISGEGNLFCSILLKPKISACDIGQASLLIGVALAQTIKSLLNDPESLSLKWPNDVLINGQKCAGILIESDLTSGGDISHIAVGIGVNINNSLDGMGIALGDFCTKNVSSDDFLEIFLEKLSPLYQDWQLHGFSAIKQQWLDDAHDIDDNLSVHVNEREKIHGTFAGLDADGALLLKTQSGVSKITAGDVEI